MSQHDGVLDNAAGAAFRADLNNFLLAAMSNNSGATAPSTTYAYMWWADTTTGLLKQRNAANSAWITIGTLASANLGLLALSGGSMTGGLNEDRGSVAMHATTMDLWAQPNLIDGTGSAVTVTAIANAPQAGARRVLYPITGTIITNGATFAVDGAANYTTAAGDALEFEAVTVSTYKVHITKKDGTAVAGGVSVGVQLVHFQDQKANGTHGGASSATWNTRTLNTEVSNTISGASLASSQITLPAGSYRIWAAAPAYTVSKSRLRLRNITDTTTTLSGGNSTDEGTNLSQTYTLQGRFTIAAQKTFELQHYTTSAVATFGLGVACSTGESEIYADVMIWKE